MDDKTLLQYLIDNVKERGLKEIEKGDYPFRTVSAAYIDSEYVLWTSISVITKEDYEELYRTLNL